MTVTPSAPSITQADLDALLHANLSGLQGGSDPDFFHLNSTQHTDVTNLTTAEFAQLANIGTSTISTAQWGFLGAIDQGVAIADDVTFASISGDGSGLTNLPTGGALFISNADVTVVNTTVETTLIGTGTGTLTIPAADLKLGAKFKFKAQGLIGDTAMPDFTVRLKLGSVVIGNSGAQQLGSITDDHWVIEFEFVIRSEGVTGTIVAAGGFLTSNNDHFAMINSGVVIIDTTADQAIDLTATWGTANTQNTVTAQIIELESTIV